MLDLVDAVEHDRREVAGIGVHQVLGDVEPLPLPLDVEADPGLVVLLADVLQDLLFQLEVPGHCLVAQPGQGLQLFVQLRWVHSPAKVPPRDQARDNVPGQLRGRKREHVVEGGHPHPLPGDHGPDGLGADIPRVVEGEVHVAVSLRRPDEVEDAVVPGRAAGRQRCPSRGADRGNGGHEVAPGTVIDRRPEKRHGALLHQ